MSRRTGRARRKARAKRKAKRAKALAKDLKDLAAMLLGPTLEERVWEARARASHWRAERKDMRAARMADVRHSARKS